MKGLLQSKKFRKNLGKWLFMYTGVMLLLTTVITYSKYITSLQSKSDASTARFELHFNCESSNGKNCGEDTEAYEVTEDGLLLTYTFTVDASKMDVKSKLKLLTFVDKSFTIENISIDKCVESETKKSLVCPLAELEIPKDISGEQSFEVKVKYNGTLDELSKDKENPTRFDEFVTIGYSVEQIQ